MLHQWFHMVSNRVGWAYESSVGPSPRSLGWGLQFAFLRISQVILWLIVPRPHFLVKHTATVAGSGGWGVFVCVCHREQRIMAQVATGRQKKKLDPAFWP